MKNFKFNDKVIVEKSIFDLFGADSPVIKHKNGFIVMDNIYPERGVEIHHFSNEDELKENYMGYEHTLEYPKDIEQQLLDNNPIAIEIRYFLA